MIVVSPSWLVGHVLLEKQPSLFKLTLHFTIQEAIEQCNKETLKNVK